jgi:hypothetical protein
MRQLTETEKTFLADLRSSEIFQTILRDNILPQIPGLPAYQVDEHGIDNRAEWMQASIERDGFIRCLALLGVAND